MRRLELCALVSGVLFISACGSSSDNGKDGSAGHDGSAGADAAAGTTGGGGTTGTAGSDGGVAGTTGAAGTDGGVAGNDGSTDSPTDSPATDGGGDATDGSTDAAPLSAAAMRGQYLVGILGCSGCHTPAATDAGSTPFAGRDCFAGSAAGPDCLSSANLTNDPSGIKNLSDQQVIDAFTTGVAPEKLDGGAQYLFANMPYYQFTALKSDDAKDIVAYLRALTPVSHTVHANTGKYATRPTAAEWSSVSYADLPNATAPAATDGGADAGDGGADAGTPADLTNGKYLAALACVTCHTVNTAATAPFALDEAKAYQGGKKANTTVTVPADGGTDGGDGGTTMITKEIQSANLTPDTTGLATWTVDQIVTAIRMGKDEAGRTICSPMRPFPSMTAADAKDIASYLKGIPAKVNAITETCE
jgi:mono/diheme cytochrome c family protein